jgi:hypothetical protein
MTATECALLSLPGGILPLFETQRFSLMLFPELRNHIYSFAIEPEDATLCLSRTLATEKTSLKSTSKRLFFSLTQVCGQVRSEFLPMYRLRNTVHIY